MVAMPFLDNLKTLRERAGISMSALARAANVDRGTIVRVERHDASRTETLMRLINALNELYYRKSGALLVPETLITEKSRFGGRKMPE